MNTPRLAHEAVLLMGSSRAVTAPLARRIERYLGYRRVDLDHLLDRRADVDDPVGRRIAIARARGLQGPREAVLTTLVGQLARLPLDTPVVVEGFPRTPLQVAAIDDGRVPLEVVMALWVDGPDDRSRSQAVERGRRPRGGGELRQQGSGRADADALASTRSHYARRGILHSVDANGDPDAVCAAVLAVLEPDSLAR